MNMEVNNSHKRSIWSRIVGESNQMPPPTVDQAAKSLGGSDKEHSYSSIFYDLQDKEYYTIPKEKLNFVHYSRLSKPRRHDVEIMKRFDDERVQRDFTTQMTDNQRYYAENGYLILRKFIPDSLIDEYLALRKRKGLDQGQFSDNSAYVEHDEMLSIAAYKPLMDVIRELHGCDMGLIFTLTGFTSTLRGWHQDAYLDRDDAIPRLASWISCGDVEEDCGPFEYVPGSHRWMALSNVKINEFLKPDYHWPGGHRVKVEGVPAWGRMSEAFIDPSVYAKIDRDGARIEKFTAKKGDVMLWYGRLMHRGSPPSRPGATRTGLIGHYAPVFERERGYFARTLEGARYLVPPRQYDTYFSQRQM